MTQHSPRVLTGLDVLVDDSKRLARLTNARVGLLVNPTSVTHTLLHAIDVLRERGCNIVRLFGPEHGVRGEAQDMESVEEDVDPLTGIETVSLYGHEYESLIPPRETVADLDILIADIQDVGARYYTYVYTIGLAMKACGEVDTEVWVLDRPNPINGVDVAGNVVEPGWDSFVGMQPIAVRHGMTCGELARYFARFGGWSCELDVVEMRGWTREKWFDETGLPWVLPSPNMPTLDTATVYPGQCLLEGTNMSEGRGTTRPFEFFGAPYVDAYELLRALEAYEIAGCVCRPISFRPKFQKFGEQTCAGLQVHVTDRSRFDSVEFSYAVLLAMWRLYSGAGFEWRKEAYEFVQDRLAIDLLLGDPELRVAIEDGGAEPADLVAMSTEARRGFEEERAQCLIYTGEMR